MNNANGLQNDSDEIKIIIKEKHIETNAAVLLVKYINTGEPAKFLSGVA
ncbi:MAG: hypothetical protein JNL23_02665 [Chitinophagaceae bacterium]|nr:hypothetical protein [Chitinophagaceae bacterium]